MATDRPAPGRTDHDRTARAIRGEQPVRSPVLELRQGQVQAVDTTNQRVDITLGAGTALIKAVVHLDAYLPTVGDTCWVLVNGPDLLVLDRLSAPGQAPGNPFGHVGRTAGLQDISGGFDGSGRYVDFSQAQALRGGVTFSASENALTVPRRGLYRVSFNGYWTSGSGYTGYAVPVVNSSALPPPLASQPMVVFVDKTTGQDVSGFNQAVLTLDAGDKLRLWIVGAASTFGSTGYNGAFLEVDYVGIAP